MNNSCALPLLLSTLAGLSTILGGIIILFIKKVNKKFISFSLAFAAGVMVTISLTDLFPFSEEVLIKQNGSLIGTLYALLFFSIGLVMAMLIDNFIPSDCTKIQNSPSSSNYKLYKVGLVTMIALMLHNFPEGITTFISGYQSTKLGIYISIAIALHNIPEGISIAMPIYFSTMSKNKAINYTILSALAEPLGAFIAFLFLKPFINDTILAICFALVSGIMIYISLQELLPQSREDGHTKVSLFSLLLGICIITLSHSLFN